jgi:ribosomal protein S18 acetylase RimI-like enzyme
LERIILARGLSDSALQEIRDLEKACCKHEGLNMKLNWDMLEMRSTEENNDLLYYDDNVLIGFLGIYDIAKESKEIEITGMVHPDYRRRGIFKKLFNAAKQECMDRKAERILLISEKSIDAGISFAKFTGAQYSFSEYRMKFEETTTPDFPKTGVTLRIAENKDYPELRHIDTVCFGSPEEETEDNYANKVYHSTYVAELDGKSIGKIGILMDGKDGYIFGFGIKPEYRRQGYGREVLSLSVLKLLSEQIKTVLLEVAVKNEKALLLYKSCGFKVITVYDYYEIVL